ncbi:MAG: hypothetical protein JXA89_28010 [Anaerolineae bacterium]|nr:hypothetical protein [Anaerolineae bacterium]
MSTTTPLQYGEYDHIYNRVHNRQVSQIGNWLISTLAWGPLLLWLIWPRFDARLSWHPLVGYSGAIALILNWVYNGIFGLTHRRWPIIVAILVAFNASFAIAARPNDLVTFTAVSVAGGGFVFGIVSGLIVVIATCLNRVQNYGDLEDTILLIAPLVQAAMIAGITSGAMATYPGMPFTGLAAGLAAGAFVSFFVLPWVYGIINTVAAMIVDRSDGHDPVYWKEGTK